MLTTVCIKAIETAISRLNLKRRTIVGNEVMSIVFKAVSLSLAMLVFVSPAAAGAATINGSIKFTGAAPGKEAIRFSADPACAKQHKAPVPKEDVVVNGNGTLKNVIVYVKEGLKPAKHPMPASPATLDQKGCMYVPHVFTMRAGQELKVLNSDPTLHNVHAMPKQNKPFNNAMISNKVPPLTKKFEKPEIPVKIKCEIHPWMSAYVGVFDHPFHTVSNDTGAFTISGLPAGEYTIAAWHERFGERTAKITIGDNETKDHAFTFDGNKQ